MPGAAGPILFLALVEISSAWDACDAEGHSRGPELVGSKLLQMGNAVTGRKMSLDGTEEATCAPLQLCGFDYSGCDSLTPGSSCVVSCPPGLVGGSVRYYCFSALAKARRPPAALRSPVCFNSSASVFTQGAAMPLTQVGKKGCLSCGRPWSPCTVIEDATGPDDARCSQLTLDMARNAIKVGGQCLDMFSGPKLGSWRCAQGAHQIFEVKPLEAWPGAEQLCVKSGRGRLCVGQMGMPQAFFEAPPAVEVLRPALDALASGNNDSLVRRLLAVQTCRAKLESGAPDHFWDWLAKQPGELHRALFSTFPVHPGQVKLFHELRESFGHTAFDAQNLSSYAVAVSFAQRGKGIDEHVRFPHPSFEYNGAAFLAEDAERIRQEMIKGKHCGIQSNECRNLHKCCGKPDAWKFKWPRDPSPSVRDWAHWMVNKTVEHPGSLWMNPVTEVPWTFGAYIWPSPIAECEWVHDKLIRGQAMEGKWYLYDSSFHKRICAGGSYHPDSLPGIAVYGGVCGRMAQLEWRKTGCMGMPATMKSEPGHCAGLKFKGTNAVWTALNVVTDVNALSLLSLRPVLRNYSTLSLVGDGARCLSCGSAWRPCGFAAQGSAGCSEFEIDHGSKLFRAKRGGQCLDMFSGPKPGLWRCSASSVNQVFRTDNGGEGLTITSVRGTLRFEAFPVPPTPVDDRCLSCKRAWSSCTLAPPDSTDCSKFEYDQKAKQIKSVRFGGQCIDMNPGPVPALWRCNSGARQRATPSNRGLLSISADRGTLRFLQSPVASDPAERNRCLKCARSWSACEYAVAGSTDCTEFAYDPGARLVRARGDQCLDMYSGPRPGLWRCFSGHVNQVAAPQGGGRLRIQSGRGTMLLARPDGAPLPQPKVRWESHGIHEISCTKKNCNFPSLMSLDSSQVLQWRHKEAALAAVEAVNGFEMSGLWPTAHDEARLAASVAFALKKAGVSDNVTEPLVAWALRRNPALYDAWELAADYPAGGPLDSDGQPSRDNLASHRWHKQLQLLRLSTSGLAGRVAADRFAREHLLAPGGRLQALPQLRQALANRLCGALSGETVEDLGEAGRQCALLQDLTAGRSWPEAQAEMLRAEVEADGGNGASEDFLLYWEVVAKLVISGVQDGKATALVEGLLAELSVGYIDERSRTFFAQNRRVLLRGPYAHVLQLAGALLPKERRLQLLSQTQAVLEAPLDHPGVMLGSTDALRDDFLAWLSAHANASSHGHQASSVSDGVDGYSAGDGADPEVMAEFRLDRNAEVELGAKLWDEAPPAGNGTSADRYDVQGLLSGLLRLHGPGSSSPSSRKAMAEGAPALAQGEAAAALRPQASGEQRGEASGSGTTPSELVQHCVDDELSP